MRHLEVSSTEKYAPIINKIQRLSNSEIKSSSSLIFRSERILIFSDTLRPEITLLDIEGEKYAPNIRSTTHEGVFKNEKLYYTIRNFTRQFS